MQNISVSEIAEEFTRIVTCNQCLEAGDTKILRDEDFNPPQPGYVGRNYERTRVLLVGQNPGVSPPRFATQDLTYAHALLAVRNDPSADNINHLQDVLDEIIPTWPVRDKYFPLAECVLQLEDIAYFNLVRCRTKNNTIPSSRMIRTCISAHFVRWLDWLHPQVVICIGKWAHDNTSYLLESRNISHSFMNRMRSLSSKERRKNRDEVVQLVQTALRTRKS